MTNRNLNDSASTHLASVGNEAADFIERSGLLRK